MEDRESVYKILLNYDGFIDNCLNVNEVDKICKYLKIDELSASADDKSLR